ncbi:MAG: tRNA(Met) cytidine acetyltransferase TmcA [Candidatus Nezhaarchaeales archaeon]|nr:MAG: tRNA(Met) cytidine acetyltransferase [Candidatus Nezhaarchaeota archaeon WYZ-LMO8]TDA36555.1 MAG: tRNA(Met) cytidine acetyltransferase [Candidatus Nezhaarchaeota archaeon WYZ-LMO7]
MLSKSLAEEIIYSIADGIRSFQRRMIVLCSSGDDKVEVAAQLVDLYIENINRAPSMLYVIDSFDEMSLGVRGLKKFREFLKSNIDFQTITYLDTESVMGLTYDILILDVVEEMRPNDLGRLIETVRGGGFIILLAPPLNQWVKNVTRFQRKLLIPPYTTEDLKRFFTRRFINKLKEHKGIWVIDLESGYANYNKPIEVRIGESKIELPPGPLFPRELYLMSKTNDQVKALLSMEAFLKEKRYVLVITSNRGRGKSAILGLGLAGLLNAAKRKFNVVVTAPSLYNVQVLFEFLKRGLEKLNMKFKEERSKEGLTREVHTQKGRVMYKEPYDAAFTDAKMVIVDEAAGIPVHLLLKIKRNFKRAIFSSTVHGYEGAGRGFSIRFLSALRRESGRTPLLEMSLKEPIRYAPEDPIEAWLYDALLLDAEPTKIEEEPVLIMYEEADLEKWFIEEESKLREFIGIYVLAHYRNRPDDVALIGEAPHHFARLLRTDDNAIVVALHLAREGGLSDEDIEQILAGFEPSGNVVPSLIVKYYPPYRYFAKLTGWRIVRIAVHPQLTDKGLGSLALRDLCDEARKEEVDWVGAGFGATRDLLNFWIKNEFFPVHISPTRNPASGEYSVIVIKPISKKAQKLMEIVNNEFKLRFLNSLYDTYFDLETEVARLLLRSPYGRSEVKLSLSKTQRARLKAYVNSMVTYEAANDAIGKLVRAHFMLKSSRRVQLDSMEEELLVAKCLQGKSWSESAKACGIAQSKIKSAVRGIVARLWEGYRIEEA